MKKQGVLIMEAAITLAVALTMTSSPSVGQTRFTLPADTSTQRQQADLFSLRATFLADTLHYYATAIDTFKASLVLYAQLEDTAGMANVHESLGFAFRDNGLYDSSIAHHQRSADLRRAVIDTEGEALSLNNIGEVYQYLSHYEKAAGFFDRALVLVRRIQSDMGEAVLLNNGIGLNNTYLGRYTDAIDAYQRAAGLFRVLNNPEGEAKALVGLGFNYYFLDRYEQAVAAYDSAIQLFRMSNDRTNLAVTYGNLLMTHAAMQQYTRAMQYGDSALTLAREVNSQLDEGVALMKLATVLRSIQDDSLAVQYLTIAITIFDSLRTFERSATAHGYLMNLWRDGGQMNAAILHGKLAVNLLQQIRLQNRGLPLDIQKDYLRSKEATYRDLAGLLIEQGRLPEAQQILRMLKEEEYFDFIERSEKEASALETRATFLPGEEELQRIYSLHRDSLMSLGTQRGKLAANRNRTKAQDAELTRLNNVITASNRVFFRTLDRWESELRSRPRTSGQLYDIKEDQALMTDLREMGPGVVALYTLIAPDKFRLILRTSELQVAAEYGISASDLNKKIGEFFNVLTDRLYDPKPIAQELYRILIGPVEKDLKTAKAHTIMVSLDGALRYVPLTALHDGQGYLVEKYRFAMFTPASKTRLTKKMKSKWTGVGFGASRAYGEFAALPGVRNELLGILRDPAQKESKGVLPGTIYLDDDFTYANLSNDLAREFPLVHIASHFSFVPGNDNASFLLLGDGSKLSLRLIRQLPNVFANVECLTLSACNTATGSHEAQGKEVEGFGTLAQRLGALSVVATLWPVPDATTPELMKRFYRLREEMPAKSKIEALRQAQLALLSGEVNASSLPGQPQGATRGDKTPSQSPAFARDRNAPFAHPYFWAPFILIGNWK